MGAFCVFGISRAYCRDQAERKTISHDNETIVEWAARRDVMAAQLFEECEKPVRISPEFDAPQFAHDWMAIAPNEIKLAKVMVRGPKLDGGGKPIKRLGVPVMTWVEFQHIRQFTKDYA